MLSKVFSFALSGLEGFPVEIEADLNAGIASYETVGLPDASVKEAKERVRSAIKNSGFGFPVRRIIINLAPADKKKEGVVFDLPTALAVLAASGQVKGEKIKEYVIIGELSLDGSVKAVKGLLPILISATKLGYRKFIIPAQNSEEAAFISSCDAIPVCSLKQIVSFFNEEIQIKPVEHRSYLDYVEINRYKVDFSEVKGQALAKRAMEIAVSGAHNILMVGSPGSGKTLLAKCVPTIMPPMSFDEALETTMIHSVAGKLDLNKGIICNRPFEAPHHTTTAIALTGGGHKAMPGVVSLAHNGVLFLDELPEYNKKTLETLRQPLEDGEVTVSRLQQTANYPSRFMLIASMNPCPCGNYGSKTRECICSPGQIKHYLDKISGPLLDRIDLQVEVDNVSYVDLRNKSDEESSESVRQRVIKAREIQYNRYKDEGIFTNSRMTNSLMKRYCSIDLESERLLDFAYDKFRLTARGINRILKIARTIADMDGSDKIELKHVSEALQYRTSNIKDNI